MAMNAEAKLDDMNVVIEILIRLPPKSVFRFISVSKTWEKTISTDPFFLRSYSRRNRYAKRSRLLAILEKKKNQTLDRELPPPPPVRFPDADLCYDIRNRKEWFYYHSSNGLCLTTCFPTSIHVVDVVTQKWFTLPWRALSLPYIAIMCEDNLNELKANFIVVRAVKDAFDEIMKMETYTSRTDKWTVSTVVADEKFFPVNGSPTVANGFFHYGTGDHKTIVVYDPKDRENNRLQLIRKPKCSAHRHVLLTRSTADDVLWLFVMEMRKSWKFFMLPRGEDCPPSYKQKRTIAADEWVLMYDISCNSLMKLDHRSIYAENDLIISRNPCAIVIGAAGEVIFPHSLGYSLLPRMEFCRHNLCPYLGSDFLSSYALPERTTLEYIDYY